MIANREPKQPGVDEYSSESGERRSKCRAEKQRSSVIVDDLAQ